MLRNEAKVYGKNNNKSSEPQSPHRETLREKKKFMKQIAVDDATAQKHLQNTNSGKK